MDSPAQDPQDYLQHPEKVVFVAIILDLLSKLKGQGHVAASGADALRALT